MSFPWNLEENDMLKVALLLHKSSKLYPTAKH